MSVTRRRPGPCRRFALKALQRIEQGGAYSSFIAASPDFNQLSSKDRNLALELVLGTLRRRGTLDRVLGQYWKGSLDSLDPDLLLLLRMGAYQLLFLDRIPPYAALYESAELCRKAIGHRPVGLLNAILRNLQRDLESWKERLSCFPDQELQQADWLSLPEWLWQRWLERYGLISARKWAEACNLPPRTDFRVLRATREDKQQLGVLKNQGIIGESGNLTGAYSVTPQHYQEVASRWKDRMYLQSCASQCIGWLLPLESGETALDLCAAPGGKTLILSERTGHSGRIIAMDRHEHRLQNLANSLNRIQVMNTLCVVGDAGIPMPFKRGWRKILLDAPCSGLGTIRRNPEIRWRVQSSDLLRLQVLQLKILRNAAENLLPGGTLLYSTCSTEPEENEQVIEAFLDEEKGFARGIPKLQENMGSWVGDDGYFRTCPLNPEEDGFFAALLVRRKKDGLRSPEAYDIV
jgi:16S rRNA (cytosine967-C5)-methyltransferase